METTDTGVSFIEADVQSTLSALRRGRLLSCDSEIKYKGFLSSPLRAIIFQVVLLLAAVAAYTFGPLLVSWSAIVRIPDSARFTTVVLPARGTASAHDWYGVELGYQPGSLILYVLNVSVDSLAHRSGILAGDVVGRAWQGDRVIWPPNPGSNIPHSDEILEVKCFLERSPSSPSCSFQKIDQSQPLSVNFDMTHVVMTNSKPPYFPLSTTLVKTILFASLFSSLSAAQNKDNLKVIFSARTFRLLIIPGLGWSLGEVCEILASSNLSPALYSVVSQSRILGAAVCMRLLLGTKQTALQSLILVSLSIVILCYVQIPDYIGAGKCWTGFGDSQDEIMEGMQATKVVEQKGINMGLVYAFMKIVLAVVMGVVGQKAMTDPHLKDLNMMATQASIYLVTLVPLVPFTLCTFWVTGWQHGFFGGVTVEFYHCVKDWRKDVCFSTVPVAQVEQGWDHRTLAVLFFYGYNDIAINAVLKAFDALIVNMVKGTATLATYFFSLAILDTRFNLTKCGLIFAIMLQFVQYAIAPKCVEPLPPKAASDDTELCDADSLT